MKQATIFVKALVAAVVAGFFGFFPFVFTQFTGSPNIGDWVIEQFIGAGLTLVLFFLAALAIGYLYPRFWFVAVAIAWFAVLTTIANVNPPELPPDVIVQRVDTVTLVALFVLPFAVSLAGAYLGKSRRLALASRSAT
jgi:hypothetical protein